MYFYLNQKDLLDSVQNQLGNSSWSHLMGLQAFHTTCQTENQFKSHQEYYFKRTSADYVIAFSFPSFSQFAQHQNRITSMTIQAKFLHAVSNLLADSADWASSPGRATSYLWTSILHSLTALQRVPERFPVGTSSALPLIVLSQRAQGISMSSFFQLKQMSEILTFRRSHYLTSRERNLLNHFRDRSKWEVLHEDHTELSNDQWQSLSIIKGFPTYFRIKIEPCFPFKMKFEIGPFVCTLFLSFTTLFPEQDPNPFRFELKQKCHVVIKRPKVIHEYVYGCIRSDYSTSVKLKAWFQQNPFDRLAPFEYKKKRSITVNTQLDEAGPQYSIRYNTIDQATLRKVQVKSLDKPYKEKALEVKQKRFQLQAQKLIKNYQGLLQGLYQSIQFQPSPRNTPSVKNWATMITLINLVEAIQHNYHLNYIVKCMVKKTKVVAWSWVNKYRRKLLPHPIQTRCLVSSMVILSTFTMIRREQIESQCEKLLVMFLRKIPSIKQTLSIENQFLFFRKKVMKIQQYFRNKITGFKLLIQKMLDEYKRKSSDPLFTKQRTNLVISSYFQYLNQRFKQEYNRYLLSKDQYAQTLITISMNQMKKPHIEVLKHRQKLYEIIMATK